jgi:LysM repeat protein
VCFSGKLADIIIMEIMSFVSSTDRTRFQNRARISHKSAGKKFFSFFTGQKTKKPVKYNEMDFSFDAQYDIPISLQTPFMDSERRSAPSSIANFFKGNALFFLILVISVCASMSLAYYLNTLPQPADTLVFPESISENDTALLNAAMSNFLTNSGDALDAEKPLHEDFTEKLSVLFSEPVAYSNYTVKSGENLTNIAKKFGLQNIGSIISVNSITNVRKLRSGQKLIIPSMDGIMHKITKQDTLSSISAKYNVSIENLVDVNNLDSEEIFPGETIFISGAKMSQQDLKKALGEVWSFPLPRASFQRISSPYG